MLLKKIPAVGGKLAATAERVKDSLKYLLVSGVFFEEFGFTYFGPVDGHNYDEFLKIFNMQKKRKVLFFCMLLRKKEKGIHQLKEIKRVHWHGTGPYKIETGDFVKTEQRPSLESLVSETVRKLAREDERIVAITPAMPVGSKLEGFAREFPERFYRCRDCRTACSYICGRA